ncbi:MAG: ATP-binding protein [Bacteroidales bacterium]|nr:ATP-binding protein [Bacteroidales bacterium]
MNQCFKILIISQEKNITSPLSNAVQNTNFNYKCVDSCEMASGIIESFLPDIVLCEMQLIENDNGELFKKIRRIKPQTIINIVINQNEANAIFNAMEYGINNCIILPLEINDLSNYLKKYEYLLRTRPQKKLQNTIEKPSSFSLTAHNSLTEISSIVDELLEDTNPIFENIKTDLRIGLEELIINAIEHGNLNISFEEKSTAILNGTFDSLLAQRQADERYKNKSITVTFHQEPEYDEWFIKDEGIGFNPCDIPCLIRESELKNLHGRGIFISRFHFDEIQYSEGGTKVRLRRYVPIFI